VKTQNRSLEIVSKLSEFSVEVSCLLTRRYRLVSQSIASHVVFEGDFWGDTVVEFSHSLGQKQSFSRQEKPGTRPGSSRYAKRIDAVRQL